MADMMMPGPVAPEPPPPSMEQMAAFEQMRQQVSPTEVNRELLATAEQADPVAVAEFKRELADLNVAPEVIDMLNAMVDEVLANPGDYPAIRQKYLTMGVDEELLPEAFDAAMFAALNMALDELRGPGTMAPPQAFARGGIASLKPMAREMAAAGRNGDTMVAHISPVEAQILRRYGGSATINPETGAPEFFLKKMFKSIGKAVKKFASSTVGKIITTVALGFFVGPAAASMLGVGSAAGVAAVSGFVGGAGSTLLSGGNLKSALKAGAIGGLVAGAGTVATRGMGALQSAPKTTAGATASPATVNTTEGLTRTPLGAPTDVAAPVAPAAPAAPTLAAGYTPAPLPAAAAAAPPATGPIASSVQSAFNLPSAGPATLASGYTPPAMPAFQAPAAAPPTLIDRIAGAPRAIYETLSPSAIRDRALADTATKFGYASPGELAAAVKANTASAAAKTAYQEALPGLLRQYGPLAATGLGIMALTGANEEEPQTIPEGFEDFSKGISPGQRLLAAEPQRYGLNFGGVQTLATPEAYNPYTFYAAPRRAAHGGSMDKKFPRKNGPINGPGTGTSDSIPAMLSDGEFVFTAKAVRGMGNGSRRAGAKKMYALMKKLEGRQNG
jgi:hypothetical protein